MSTRVHERVIRATGAGGLLMKNAFLFAAKAILNGFLILVPIYLAVLVLLKAVGSIGKLMHPFTLLLPKWLPAGNLLSVLLVLALCLLIGAAVRTRAGRTIRDHV